VSNQPSRAVVATTFLKTSATFLDNRCAECGRRLKYKPGAWITSTGERFRTCRSCGYENPSLWQKVAENLAEAGYDTPDVTEGVLDLPQCLGDGTELQVSRDFTKVFCATCGREWDRYEFEDLMGYPLSPQLAGAIPLRIDDSKTARKLEKLLTDAEIDTSSPYLVLEVIEQGSPLDAPLWKVLVGEFKKGIAETSDDKKETAKSEATHYLAIYADSIAHYIWADQNLKVNQVSFDTLFANAEEPVAIPFNVRPWKSQGEAVIRLLTTFKNIYIANSAPYKAPLFGSAAREADALQVSNQGQKPSSLSDELEKLASLKERGLLADDEFEAAKSKLLG
jgi:DNA-directed RNA polymerase subunit RPC12/RpoP